MVGESFVKFLPGYFYGAKPEQMTVFYLAVN